MGEVDRVAALAQKSRMRALQRRIRRERETLTYYASLKRGGNGGGGFRTGRRAGPRRHGPVQLKIPKLRN